MDTYGRRKLVAGIVVGALIIIGLIVEAMQDKTLRNRAMGYLGIVGAGVIALLLLTWAAFAHDVEHPELDDWYRSLNSGSGPCCDGSDFDSGSAAHLADIDWESRDGHYRVRIEGEWVDVPQEAVIDLPNRDGRALVWFFHVDGHPRVRCFMPGAGS